MHRGGRPTVAGAGAAGSLLAAIAAAALIAPGLIGFDEWSLAPTQGSGGSLRVEPGPATAQPFTGPAASATAAPVPLGAATAPGTAPDSSSLAGRGRAVENPRPGSNGSSAGTVPGSPGAARPTDPPPGDPPAGIAEALARGAERTGSTFGGGLDRLGTMGGDALSPLGPAFGDGARGAGVVAGENARRTSKAAGDAMRRLAGGEPAVRATALARGSLR